MHCAGRAKGWSPSLVLWFGIYGLGDAQAAAASARLEEPCPLWSLPGPSHPADRTGSKVRNRE